MSSYLIILISLFTSAVSIFFEAVSKCVLPKPKFKKRLASLLVVPTGLPGPVGQAAQPVAEVVSSLVVVSALVLTNSVLI